MKKKVSSWYIIILLSLLHLHCTNKAINGLYVHKNQFDENAAVFIKNKFEFDKKHKRFEYRYSVEQNSIFSKGNYWVFNDVLVLKSDIDNSALQFNKDSLQVLNNDSIKISFIFKCFIRDCYLLFDKFIEIDTTHLVRLSSKDTANCFISNTTNKIRFLVKVKEPKLRWSTEFYSEYLKMDSNYNYIISYDFKSEQIIYKTFLNDTILNLKDKIYIVEDSVWFYKFNSYNKIKFRRKMLE